MIVVVVYFVVAVVKLEGKVLCKTGESSGKSGRMERLAAILAGGSGGKFCAVRTQMTGALNDLRQRAARTFYLALRGRRGRRAKFFCFSRAG